MKTTGVTVLAMAASVAISFLSAVASAQEAAPVEVTAADLADAEATAITRCAFCHGPQGHSNSPIYPSLAGQKAWYILEQLQAFKAQTRGDPYARGFMWGMSAQLTDTQMAALAAYFSKQTKMAGPQAPFSGSRTAAEVTKGKSVYNDGVPADGVAPCSACHQADAAGSDQFPRLAGQHASYLWKQLRAFHSENIYVRREQVIMNGIAAPLKDSDMKAVAFFLESAH